MQKKLEKQRAFFRSGRTIPLAFRKKALKRLGRAIRQHEKEIYAALREDLNKSKTETFMCEVGMTLAELSYMLKHLEGWAKKKYVRSPLAQFSATSFTVKEPYGVALIMSPWNYPFMLTMEPLIGAIAAGNCAVVKPSALCDCNLCGDTEDFTGVLSGGIYICGGGWQSRKSGTPRPEV